MADVRISIQKYQTISKINDIIKAAELHASFNSFITNNNFKKAVNMTADQILWDLRTLISARYEDSGIQVHKLPEYGSDLDFSFSFVGNEEYEKLAFDRTFERGKVYTSNDRIIIPKPREEVKPQELLFRTSHGEVIKGDPFINEFIHSQTNYYVPFLQKSYEADAQIFIKSIK